MTRELDDLILDLRTNEPELGTWVLRTAGDADAGARRTTQLLLANADDWLANEIVHYLKRTLKRLDVTSRSLIALIEPGSCFAGSLLELALAADRSYQLAGVFEDVDPDADAGGDHRRRDEPRPAADGQRPDPAADPVLRRRRRARRGRDASRRSRWRPRRPSELGLVTFAPDDIDWDDEVRIALEERASFSPDALTGMEANYRFAGPETHGDEDLRPAHRLAELDLLPARTRPGPDGALRKFGTGQRADFDRKRV